MMTRTEQRIHQCRQSVRFADDDGGVLAHRCISELSLEKLSCAAQTTEGVFDLVCELANHRAAPTYLGEQCVLTSDALVLSAIADLDQHRGRCAGLFEWRNVAIDDEFGVTVHGT